MRVIVASVLTHDTVLGNWPATVMVIRLASRVSTAMLVREVHRHAGLLLVIEMTLQSPQVRRRGVLAPVLTIAA